MCFHFYVSKITDNRYFLNRDGGGGVGTEVCYFRSPKRNYSVLMRPLRHLYIDMRGKKVLSHVWRKGTVNIHSKKSIVNVQIIFLNARIEKKTHSRLSNSKTTETGTGKSQSFHNLTQVLFLFCAQDRKCGHIEGWHIARVYATSSTSAVARAPRANTKGRSQVVIIKNKRV